MKLMTIGYEGLTSKEFFAILRANKVQKIIDVRELPLSHKPGFSKSALSLAAKTRKIAYVHVPELGTSREIRHDYHADHNWKRFARRFKASLNKHEEAVEELARLVTRERCCLVCFEADALQCHRSIVAERVAGVIGSSLTVMHLKAPGLE
ncbi:MAG TPA: DUF488 domain-containing protein [Anaerolineae bacterium]